MTRRRQEMTPGQNIQKYLKEYSKQNCKNYRIAKAGTIETKQKRNYRKNGENVMS